MLYFNREINNKRKELTMNYDIIKLLNLKYELIDNYKSFDYYDDKGTHHIELYLNNEIPRLCHRCKGSDVFIYSSRKNLVKHSSLTEANILLHIHKRIYKCNSCGHVYLQDSPIIEENKRISIYKDVLILNDLKDATYTYKKLSEKYFVSPTYISNLFDRKVDIKRGSLPEVLCIDELYSKKLSKYHYLCVLYSPQRKTIIDILESRRKDFLIDYFANISGIEKQNVHYVAIDMWDNYRQIIKLCLPSAYICVDSFHVIKQLNFCFNKVRIRVMKHYSNLKKEGHEYYWLLKKFWKFLLINLDKLPSDFIFKTRTGMELSKYQIVDYMLDLNSDLKQAYELKEAYREFNLTMDNPQMAIEPLEILILKFKQSRIHEYESYWKLLENWKDKILNSFYRVNGFRISNGPIEKANSEIRKLIKVSYGCSNFPRFRNRAMFIINKNEPILGVKKPNNNNRTFKPRGSYK